MTSESTKKEPQNCWEFMDCPPEKREECPIYKYNYGAKCWLLIEDFIEGCSRAERGCYTCPWYKKNMVKEERNHY